MNEVDKLRAQGLDVASVGEILDGPERDKTPTRFEPARLDGTPPFPEPGIYFGMDDETYHALPGFSATGVKLMAASPMLFWGKTAWLNAEQAEEKAELEKGKEHLPIGHAYECRILEGQEAYDRRFVCKPDKPDFGEGVIQGTDAIKAAIMRLEAVPVTRVPTGEEVPDPKAKEPGTMKPVLRAAVKADWIAQLQALDPAAKIYEALMADFDKTFDAEHAGKLQMPARVDRRIQIAARMIERDPGISPYMKGGQVQVVLIWYCPVTGVPMKAKIDKLQITRIIDMKTLANQRERSINEAIRWEIGGYHYNVQPSVYFEGAEVVRQMVREHGASVIRSVDDPDSLRHDLHEERVAWAMKWASHRLPDEWGWLFQQKGIAPITRLVWYPRGGTTKMVTDDIVSAQKRRFREWSETFGTEPWLDLADPYMIADEDIPRQATEI